MGRRDQFAGFGRFGHNIEPGWPNQPDGVVVFPAFSGQASMSNQPATPTLPGKPMPPMQMPPSTGGGAGRVLGCAAIGCGSVVLLIAGLCGLGYWGLFYSSYPLRWIEAGIEQEGYVEIDGMKGNMSTGVEVEKIRFREDRKSDQWSELTGLEMKYRTTGSMFGQQGVVVDSVQLKGARLIAELDGDVSVSGNMDFSELIEELSDLTGADLDVEARGNFEIKQVLLQNIVLTDPGSGREVRVDEIRFDGLKLVDGELTALGDIVVRADLISIGSAPSDVFGDQKINRQYQVLLKQALSQELLADLPLQFDFGFSNRSVKSRVRMFGDQLEFLPGGRANPYRLVFREFTPAEFLDPVRMGILPSQVQMELERPTGKNKDWELVAGKPRQFLLGKTLFEVSDVTQSGNDSLRLSAEGKVDGAPVAAEIRLGGKLPFVSVRLKGAPAGELEDLWARTVFGTPFALLDPEQKTAVTRTVNREADEARAAEAAARRQAEEDQQDAGEDGEGMDPDAESEGVHESHGDGSHSEDGHSEDGHSGESHSGEVHSGEGHSEAGHGDGSHGDGSHDEGSHGQDDHGKEDPGVDDGRGHRTSAACPAWTYGTGEPRGDGWKALASPVRRTFLGCC